MEKLPDIIRLVRQRVSPHVEPKANTYCGLWAIPLVRVFLFRYDGRRQEKQKPQQ